MSDIAKALIQDLKEDILRLERLESNIEIVWELEKLHNNKAFKLSADLLRKSLQ